jgi:hypothetical protein
MKQQVQDLIRFLENKENGRPERIYTWVTNGARCCKQQGGLTTVLFART